ncbi:phosphohistidine phosphatase [Desulfuromusa kysingii]|uniref:Phosphohistidine phosphatase n=1 Tax=Desulfuromusa kysingii TaxID=37625 RepID=A0A1H3ZRN3_9BACT|nr:histidine phosphatase family protein [Desulfuromusa kysingii]SEA26380.1 phosphohistidine phosphatase [Desulfuromusa kysingii]
MKHLTLIRHAKSDWSEAALVDFDRPLNARGKKAAFIMGQRMAKAGLSPDLVISSPAKRARSTAKLLAREIALPKTAISYQTEIYAASLTTLQQIISSFPDVAHIALIGHNPALTNLAKWLNPQAPDWLPTCAVINFQLAIARWENISTGCGTILFYGDPKNST